MTTGYLWTGQYEECKDVIEKGRPHSMELDEENLDGHWATNNKTGMDFFIINDAIFSKLCILGEDVEPCFEGSSITAPEVSTSFTKIDEDFKKTLYTMMQDLRFALKGGLKMETDETIVSSVVAVEEPSEEIVETPTVEEEVETNTEEIQEDIVETNEETTEEEIPEETTTEEENLAEVDNEEQTNLVETEEDIEVQEEPAMSENESVEESVSKEVYSELEAKYTALENQYKELVEFKKQIEDKEKDTLINSFYMLSEEDKADVITNKSKYSLDDIEAKLSVICVRKKINFDLEDDNKEEEKEDTKAEDAVVTYNLVDGEGTSTPAWIKACKNTRDSKK